jgi:hypothetical protein
MIVKKDNVEKKDTKKKDKEEKERKGKEGRKDFIRKQEACQHMFQGL